MRIRMTLLAGVAVGAALLASTANAAPTTVITDAKGDAKAGQAAYDIVSVAMETTRTSKSKTAPLKDFIVTMELGGAPNVQPGTSYQLLGTSATCGTFYAYAYWGALDAGPTSSVQFSSCGPLDALGEEDSFLADHAVKVDGNKLIFTVSSKMMPPKAKPGMGFSELRAFTAITEPVVGYTTMDFEGILTATGAEAGAIDVARGDKVYKYGS